MAKKDITEIKNRFYDWTGTRLISKKEEDILQELSEAKDKLVSEIEEEERLLVNLVNEIFS